MDSGVQEKHSSSSSNDSNPNDVSNRDVLKQETKILKFNSNNSKQINTNTKLSLNTEWLEEQIKSCNEASTYLFYRVEEHELKSQELFDKIAKQEVQKRLLEKFYKKFKELKEIKDEAKRNSEIEKLNREFSDVQILSNELDNYTKSQATKEFLLTILTIEDLKQIELASIAITGNKNDAIEILSSNIGLFESYVDNRAKFVTTISKIHAEYKHKEIQSSDSRDKTITPLSNVV